ncbi:MAG TPA: NAD(P)-dependent alcohol dehydrogenase [Gammaproteobacteria bacterium]|nr:NAD(P)-dependent alcohol dehydrogenase [Gammaproteobacteria bacterium]
MKLVELSSFGLDGLTYRERERPSAGPGQVLLHMRSASLNYHDLVTIMGVNPRLPLPVIPLSDGCGEVLEVGDGVTGVAPGDLVVTRFFQDWHAGGPTRERLARVPGDTVDGCMTEYAVFDATAVSHVPEHLSDLEAATLPCAGLTAWRAIVIEGGVTAGDTVLLLGTGGVSIFALQFAKLLGAEVIITSSSDEKLERAAGLGADHLINYRRREDWHHEVQKLTGGRGVDHVVEVGGAGTFEKSLKCLRIGGHVSVIGVLSGHSNVVPIARIMAANARVKGITVGSEEHFDGMCRAIALHRMRPVVGEVLGFEDLRAAFDLMQEGGHFGKICLDLD